MRWARIALGALALAAAGLAPGSGRAEPPSATSGFSVDSAVGANPAAARIEAAWFVRRRLPDGQGVLWSGRETRAGAIVGFTPAYGQLALEASAVPIAFLELRARYALTGFLGAYGGLWRLPSPDAPFGDAESRASHAEPGLGQSLTVAPALRARAGRLVLWNELAATAVAVAAPDGWYYWPEQDTLVATRDVILGDTLAITVEAWRGAGDAGLRIGPTADVTRSVKAELTRVRLGGVAALTLSDRGWLQRPRLTAWVGMLLRDPNRKGGLSAALVVACDLGVGTP
jgi:hypothetical protein